MYFSSFPLDIEMLEFSNFLDNLITNLFDSPEKSNVYTLFCFKKRKLRFVFDISITSLPNS